MRCPEEYTVQIMKLAGINFTATLPCDRIKNLLPLVHKSFNGIELSREEDGLGICAGAWLAGARPMMIIQSSGIGNMMNALASLNLASAIPVPILASFRGFYKEGITSQIPFGQHLQAILRGLGIRHTLIDETEKLAYLSDVIQDAHDHCHPHIALVSPKVWETSPVPAWQKKSTLTIHPRAAGKCKPVPTPIRRPEMTRFEAIESLGSILDSQVVVANLGVPSKELFAVCDRPLNYYMLGSMGLASSIGFGISRFTERKVIVMDGDGSILMNPNAQITIGHYQPRNLIILAMDNACYGSTGSQRTYTRDRMDLESFAGCCGFKNTARVHSGKELKEAVQKFDQIEELSFIHVVLKPGNSSSPNIPLSPREITIRFKACLEK